MKNQSYQYFLFIMIYAGMTTNSALSQDVQPQDSQTRSTTFKQLSNSELCRFGMIMKERQGLYNYAFKMLFFNPSFLADKSNDNFINVLQKLEWVIQTNKTTYLPGEPVEISVYLKNNSSEEMTVLRPCLHPGFFLNSLQIKFIWKDEKIDVNLTYKGLQYYLNVIIGRGNLVARRRDILQPGNMVRLDQPFQTLNLYYDLSEEGEYELTFYTRDFLADDEHQLSEYPKPCTVRFKIEGNTNWLDQHVEWPDEGKNEEK